MPESTEPTNGAHPRAQVAVSIVSHGHGPLVLNLVRQLQSQAEPCLNRVIVTLNTPEPSLASALAALEPVAFTLETIPNRQPHGFGHNHNAALATLAPDGAVTHVCVLNPDLQLRNDQPLQALVDALSRPDAGLSYPRLLGSDGQVQDNERTLPSPASLWRRRILRRAEHRIDWVSGACMMLRWADWQRLGGFDAKFHMYCEDVDLSLRARRDVGTLVRANTTMAHPAQRASHRRLRHLAWHVQSLLRLWRQPSYRWALQHPAAASRTAA